MQHSEDDMWFVQVGDGAVRAFTLDELDAAFSEGRIDEATLVRRDGSLEWKALGVVLAGEHDHDPAATHTHTEPQAGPPSAQPVTVSAPPPAVELDIDEPNFGAPKRRVLVIGAVAVLTLGALGVTAFRVAGSDAATPANLGASLPQAVVHAPTGEPGAAADAGPKLSEEQRRLLMEADKKREAEAAQRRGSRERNAPSRPIKIGDPIQKGGSKYDPLNGAL
ncbi:MAG: DUF4339 domain-containing protein [Myxococcales bacterium]|nr:DUF4339 domain-containing protein [Myxococcales bacterium]